MAQTQSLTSQPLPKRKKEQRTDIWSNLLRQTREAQARNKTQTVQSRELVVCGGSPDDQHSFLQYIVRPPPAQPPSRNQDRRQFRPKGELRLSNRYAYGYGHVTLYSPPQLSATGVPILGAEAEEVARLEVHTIPQADEQYVGTLRRLLAGQKEANAQKEETEQDMLGSREEEVNVRRPAVCVVLDWKEPWKFLGQLRQWIRVLALALLPPQARATDPLDVIKDAQVKLTLIVQHTEAQELLLREGYKEEDFDYISQCLRTAILPLHPFSALVYTNSNAPPQQPSSPLTEAQKVIYGSLDLDLGLLSPKVPRTGEGAARQELTPKHEFMDRMAIIIPAGWDNTAFIRTLSETFAPEDILNSWLVDLQPAPEPIPVIARDPEPLKVDTKPDIKATAAEAEVYETSPVDETFDDSFAEPPRSPTKTTPSAICTYESKVPNPQAHKAPKPPQIEVTTKPDQTFLGEMRAHLQDLEASDRERDASRGVSNTSLSSGGRVIGLPSGEQTGALNDLGDVSFNVGGVSYDTVSAEAAIERLKRPQHQQDTPTRNLTPKPLRPGRDQSTPLNAGKDASGSRLSSESKELPIDKLEEYFASLMKRGGGMGASREGTPTRSKPNE